jgi:ribosomal-protein-serine acetyltransferase
MTRGSPAAPQAIAGDGVAIRPYRLEDAAPLFAAAIESIPAVFPWLPWCHPGYTLKDATEWLSIQVMRWSAREELQFAIVTEGDHYLGGCGLNGINREHGYANLGYWVRSAATGRGVAPRAVQLLRDWAFAHTDLVRLEVVVAAGNTRSARVAEKAGATLEGLLRGRIRLHGRVHDALMYSFTR